MATTVLVGVDGSEPSDRALDWALREAKLRGDRLLAIHVWSMPWAMGYDVNWADDREVMAKDARAAIARQVASAEERTGITGVPVEVQAVMDERPGYALATMADQADLLVVGSRGRGGFTGSLLGSVSTTAVHHATCPVVVVRP